MDQMITNSTVAWCFEPLSRRHNYIFLKSYIQVSDNFTIKGLIAKSIMKFIYSTICKVFGYRFFAMEKVVKPCLTFKKNSSLEKFETHFNAYCSLVLFCKDIIPKYGRTRSKHFFYSCYVFVNMIDLNSIKISST